MANWTSLYESQPAGSESLGSMDDEIRSTRVEVRARVKKEHLFGTSASELTRQGMHKQGSARVFVSSSSPDASSLPDDAADTGLKGRIWIVVDGSNVPTGALYYHNGTTWVKIPTAGSDVLAALVGLATQPLTNLNADKLDGNHGSYYQPASSAITSSNIGSQSVKYASSAGSASSATTATTATTALKIRTSRPSSPANGDIWLEA